MKVAVGLRRVAAGKRTSGRRAAQIATNKLHDGNKKNRRFAAHIFLHIYRTAVLKAAVLFGFGKRNGNVKEEICRVFFCFYSSP